MLAVLLVSQLKLANFPLKKIEVHEMSYCHVLLFKTCGSGVILETVLLRSHEVAALVLSDSDVPGPGGGGGGGVDVQADGDTGLTGGDKHVLPGVVATDDGWWVETRNPDFEYV